jgi:PAS domain S-box-containing protein
MCPDIHWEKTRWKAFGCMSVHDHACLIYSTVSEQMAAIVPYIRDGLLRGERCVYAADENSPETVMAALAAAGTDVLAHLRNGSLEFIQARDAYIRDGAFVSENMIHRLETMVEDAKRQGFQTLRLAAEMSWARNSQTSMERVLEYEAKLNQFYPNHDVMAVCQFNRNCFSKGVLKGVIETHPLVMLSGGEVAENRFYIPPEEYLSQDDTLREVDRMLENIRCAWQHNRELHERERQLAMLISNLPGTVYRCKNDRHMTMEFLSEEVLSLTGFESAMFLEGGLIQYGDLIHPLDRETVWKTIQSALEARAAYTLNYRIVTRQGEIRWVRERGRGVFHANGSAVALEGWKIDVTEQHRMEMELRQSEERLRLARKASNIGIYEVAWTNGKAMTHFDETIAELWGIPLGSTTGWEAFFERVHPDDRADIVAAFQRSRTQEGYGQHLTEYRVVKPNDSSVRWVSDCALITFENGVPLRMIGSIKDITERKIAENSLNTLHRAIDAAAEGICVTGPIDENRPLLYVNRGFERLTGFGRNEVIGKNLSLLDSPRMDNAKRSILHDAMRAGRSVMVDLLNRRKNGTDFWNRVSATPVEQNKSNGGQYVFVLADVTEQRQVADALRVSEERFRLVTRASNDGIWDWDLASGQMWWNDRYDEILGPRPQGIGVPTDWWKNRIHPDDRERALSCLGKAVNGTADKVECHYRFIRPDKKTVYLYDRAYIVRDAAGKVARILGAVLDMTPYQMATEKLQKLSAQLVNIQEEERRRIARELHDSTAQKLTVVMLMLGQMEDLVDKCKCSAEAHVRSLIQDSVKAAADCAQEIRSLSYLLHPPLLDELGLEVSLDTYLSGFAKRCGIQVTLDAQPGASNLPQDIALTLFRVVQESLSNILRHSGSSTASVQLEQFHHRVMLEIADRGQGIAAEALEDIKNKRFASRGLGVGIMGMFERVEQIGGVLEIDSSSQGTVIRAIVPIPQREEPS